MKINYLNPEIIKNLHKLIGSQIQAIFVEGGVIKKSENMTLDGHGMIIMTFLHGDCKYKWRLQFKEETKGECYSEFYEWNIDQPVKERYNPRTGEVNYDYDLSEDFKKYHLTIEISPKENENVLLPARIKLISIYHYVGEFEEETVGDGGKYDYLAMIDIETETGRRIIIEVDDPVDTFYIYFDELETFELRLAEVHDDPGNTFGEKRYQLRHEIQ